jgi:hypothetical protein
MRRRETYRGSTREANDDWALSRLARHRKWFADSSCRPSGHTRRPQQNGARLPGWTVRPGV